MYLLPVPQKITYMEGMFTLPYYGEIVLHTSCKEEVLAYAKLLKENILNQTGFDYSITKGTALKNSIELQCSTELEEQAYELNIMADKIKIIGGTKGGVLYGIQTLRQILSQNGAVLPCLMIKDFPSIKNRGFYYDVTRGRIPTLCYLKSVVDKLSYYKINQLQLYIEHSFLFRGLSEVWRDDTPLTAEEILELDVYCQMRNVELIPSLTSFGHFYKVLRTKMYRHLCEFPEEYKEAFSFPGRQLHHTINISMEESFQLVTSLIEEYLPLFTSKHFNICADETFDLGKGAGKALADEIGTETMYIDFVSRLCQFVIDRGKRPMFWGDIICKFPQAIKKLPKETICLNWGYAKDQKEEESKALNEVGAIQYMCPGVLGWNQFINLLEDSYQNISRMCSYAKRYEAIGVLNTDWGDYGHINHPEFSTSGMIYGATFSWNQTELSFDEINKQISKLEYLDFSETFVSKIAKVSGKGMISWYNLVIYMEFCRNGGAKEEKRELFAKEELLNKAKEDAILLNQVQQEVTDCIKTMDTKKRSLVKPYLLAIEGMKLFNYVGAAIAKYVYQIEDEAACNPKELAISLEYWWHRYKEVWRSVGKEAELYRIQTVIFWYVDLLRDF